MLLKVEQLLSAKHLGEIMSLQVVRKNNSRLSTLVGYLQT